MAKRLRIARSLLKSTGCIFIQCDDNEQAPLKMLCDEIFGRNNFIGIFIQDKANSKNDTINIQRNHEYILAYRKELLYKEDGKVRPTVFSFTKKEREVFCENGEYYYLNDPITTRGEGGTLKKRLNLGYTIYYNPDTNDMITQSDYDPQLAQQSDNENEVYHTDASLVQSGYIPVRPPRVRKQLGAWTWEEDKFHNDIKQIIMCPTRTGYVARKRIFVDPQQDGIPTYIQDKQPVKTVWRHDLHSQGSV